ncbi:PQQ-dependent sugar dehydrogenase [Nocardioides ferulae]|uniref:PQQ-dependent sugar dehydrogenase n=1 Tax=Nocardioides ferulae TaxID=2340821 RepID=UPI000EB3D32C|nr:PQQ-dependent sugar dehydrogenase [Nocardioides ferulae]
MVGLLTTGVLVGCSQGGNEVDVSVTGTPVPSVSDSPTGSPSATDDSSGPKSDRPDRPPRVLGTIASGLEVPWGLAFLPSGDAVVTERISGRVLLLSGPKHRVSELGTIAITEPNVEAGLLGVAVSPDFDSDRLLYFYVSTAEDNRVVRAELRGGGLGELQDVLTGIPNGFIHDGGRLLFGPDGLLYVSTGEIGEPSLAQDRDSLAGKILRITPDGDPAPGNPFDSPVWSWGHRNVQGLAFDDAGRLWASEFGDSSFDELNLIEKGANYGWPEVEGMPQGSQTDLDFTDPQATWDVAEASPSGLAFADGYLYLAALRGERLWRVPVTGRGAGKPEPFLAGEYGRMRTVAVAPDGTLWVTTSNRDGRGEPTKDDDRIISVRP